MNRANFLVAIDSYVVRKGILSVLRNISGVFILNETDHPDVLRNCLKDLVADFIIISGNLYKKVSDLYDLDLSLFQKTILIDENKPGFPQTVPLVISLGDSKEYIVEQLNRLLIPYLEEKKNTRPSILSKREKTILKYIATGYTNKEIADRLYLSLHTVNTHRKNISNKLSIRSASGLTVYAIVNNIISIEDITI